MKITDRQYRIVTIEFELKKLRRNSQMSELLGTTFRSTVKIQQLETELTKLQNEETNEN